MKLKNSVLCCSGNLLRQKILRLPGLCLRQGLIVPTHSHPNEQVTYIVEGALKFLIQGKEIVVAAGEALCIPAKIPHSAEALQDTLNIDVFHPQRADWNNQSDDYLRGEK